MLAENGYNMNRSKWLKGDPAWTIDGFKVGDRFVMNREHPKYKKHSNEIHVLERIKCYPKPIEWALTHNSPNPRVGYLNNHTFHIFTENAYLEDGHWVKFWQKVNI